MDQEVKEALENSDKLNQERYTKAVKEFEINKEHLEKRINDVWKWPTIVISALTLILIALGVASYLNLREEIKRLDTFRSNIEKEIGESKNELRGEIKDLFEKSVKRADVKPFKSIDLPLDGQKVNAILVANKKHKWRLIFTITLKNEGDDTARELFLKIYYFDSNRIGNQSSTYREFGQESTYPPEKIPTSILPPNAAVPVQISLPNKYFDPEIKTYPMAIQVWFGKEFPNEARFQIEVIKIIDMQQTTEEDEPSV